MKFKFSVEFLIVVFLFIAIMIMSTYGSTKIIPYETQNSKLPMFSYEEFATYDESTNTILKTPNNTHSNLVTETDSSYINNVKPNKDNEITNKLSKLHWDKYGNEKLIDVVSGLPSNSSCENVSSGLSNSLGYLCPTENVQKLFKSRGGNASGASSQIGA
jgi:hypothetical protein